MASSKRRWSSKSGQSPAFEHGFDVGDKHPSLPLRICKNAHIICRVGRVTRDQDGRGGGRDDLNAKRHGHQKPSVRQRVPAVAQALATGRNLHRECRPRGTQRTIRPDREGSYRIAIKLAHPHFPAIMTERDAIGMGQIHHFARNGISEVESINGIRRAEGAVKLAGGGVREIVGRSRQGDAAAGSGLRNRRQDRRRSKRMNVSHLSFVIFQIRP